MSYNHTTVENTVCYNTNLHIKKRKHKKKEIRDTGTEISWG